MAGDADGGDADRRAAADLDAVAAAVAETRAVLVTTTRDRCAGSAVAAPQVTLDLAPLRWLRKSRQDSDVRDVRRIAREAASLADWCIDLGIERVSLFDQRGLLASTELD